MNPTFTLLVVDDEKQNRALLTELLQDDHRIILAKDGTQALERAREHRPDLILLDVLMPGMDGHAVIRDLKNDDQTRDIPVIFITALDSAGDEERGLDLGAVDYISKPFNPSIVRVRIRNHLQSVHQRRLLEQLAMLDSLTGIPNRRRLAEVYEREWRRCMRAGAPLSLIVVDVDHFKAFNDTYGHSAGDQVLQRVAASLRMAMRRSGDFVARYGGEEFVILLPGVDSVGAQAVSEQARADVEELRIPHAVSQAAPWVTISLGGATRVPQEGAPDTGLFSLADAYLYEAKHGGRNRVAWAPAITAIGGP
jgi:diguanylate cyclase (GGDEF)-like protein